MGMDAGSSVAIIIVVGVVVIILLPLIISWVHFCFYAVESCIYWLRGGRRAELQMIELRRAEWVESRRARIQNRLFSHDTSSTSVGDNSSTPGMILAVHKATQEQVGVACIICFELFNEHDVLATLPCVHTFHSDCVQPWAAEKKTCPICRVSVMIISEGNNALTTQTQIEV